MPTVELSQSVLHYDQSGSGPDVVWLAAGDQPGDVWRKWQIPDFDGRFRNTTYDARGVGATASKVDPPWSIADHAIDIAELISKVCEPPVFLVGLSMGSLIAQELCFTQPELVRAAIVTGTCAIKTGFIREWEQAEIDFRRAGGEISPEFALAHYAFLMYPSEVLGDDAKWAEVREFLIRDFATRDGEMLAEQWQACLDYDSTDRLPLCNVPLHVIGYGQDVQTPPARARQVADLAANGQFHLLEGLGHGSAFGHRPKEVNDLIGSIIDGYCAEDLASNASSTGL
jgi:pimeloyl-ACP methyl ester carboxylesterase